VRPAVAIIRNTLKPPALAACANPDESWWRRKTGTSGESAVVLSALICLIEQGYSADEASMTSWVVETTFSTAMLACILVSWMLWHRYKTRLGEKERRWREAQLAQLESVKERMKEVIDPAQVGYSELPGTPPGRVA
jgi:hypothetical protein